MTRLQVDTWPTLGILKEYGKLEKHLKMKFSGRFNLDLHVEKNQCFFSLSRTDWLCYSTTPTRQQDYSHDPHL
jgi:hypothetical protein